MVRTRVGYAGGTLADPTYQRLGDHTETFQVDFDPSATSYSALLQHFWDSHRPGSRGHSRQYMPAIFVEGEDQMERALTSRERVGQRIGRDLDTLIAPLGRFYRAEDYHQKYRLKSHSDLMNAFGPAYGEREVADSTVAARLNGYVSGWGTAAQLAAEIESFGLSPLANQKVEELVRDKSRAVS